MERDLVWEALVAAAEGLEGKTTGTTLAVSAVRRRTLRHWTVTEGLEVVDNWTDVFEPVRRRRFWSRHWADVRSVEDAACSVGRFLQDRPDLAERRAIAQARARRRELVVGREGFVAAIEVLLFEHDPIGINFETNPDEYRAEAESIVIRLPSARDAADTRTIVHEEFTSWFSPDIAGAPSRYDEIAREIWTLWSERADER